MFIERLPGQKLGDVWDLLSLDDKKFVVTALTGVLVQFSSLKFARIGCLRTGGKVGPFLIKESRLFRVPHYRTI